MFKALVEQWQSNQEQKRAIAAEKWEQEKRWREEDREEQRQRRAEEEKQQEEQKQERAAEEARREETTRALYGAHLDVLQKAATVSYVSLTCHEDTWTFLARRAFGTWSPEWLTSVVRDHPGQAGPVAKQATFKKNPNLSPGRITKQDNGMQTIEVSGDNLVTIIEELWQTAFGRTGYLALMDTDPNRSACGPLYRRIRTWLDSLEPGTVNKPGHTLVLDERLDTAQPA
ncbi:MULTISPECIES: hypothetical protein [Streptomyces]|uniref:hypothetical protein n=1 Tax=Streptomyces TaxID=1883 RepID=UPI0021A5D6A3|nr:hypothetical protein [Streptomyces atratus]MCT2547406.1 hypothetical protein [Streptomyces atratus]